MLKAVGAETPPAASTIVESLEELLEMAKRGDIVQLAAAYVEVGGCTSSQWASAPHQHQATLLGAIDMMHEKIRQHMRDNCGR